MREAGPDHVAAGGVDDALRLARAAGGVEDEERVLGGHRLGLAIRGCVGQHGCVVEIPLVLHRHGRPGDGHDQDGGDGGALRQRLVRIGLQRHAPAAAAAFVGGDQQGARAILDPVGQAVRREPAEHDGMHRADPRAGQHRDRGLDHHRQVDRHPVATLDAARLQHIGQPADLLVQRLVGDRLLLARVVPLPDDRHLVAAGLEMRVQAGGGGVQPSVLEPADRHVALEAGVADHRGRLDPGDAPRFLEPEGVWVAGGVIDHQPVFLAVDPGAGGNRRDHVEGCGL